MSINQQATPLNYKNNRTIDRAAILDEIQQTKIEEIRNNMSNNKNFNRKLNKFTS